VVPESLPLQLEDVQPCRLLRPADDPRAQDLEKPLLVAVPRDGHLLEAEQAGE
jgi:hypothetical protein